MKEFEQYIQYIKACRSRDNAMVQKMRDQGFNPDDKRLMQLAKTHPELYHEVYNTYVLIKLDGGHQAGHVRISYPNYGDHPGTADGEEWRHIGFYPERTGIRALHGPGRIKDEVHDTGRELENLPTIVVRLRIPQESAHNIERAFQQQFKESKTFALFSTNCIHFADQMLKKGGYDDGIIDKFNENVVARVGIKPIRYGLGPYYRSDTMSLYDVEHIIPRDFIQNSAEVKRRQANLRTFENHMQMVLNEYQRLVVPNIDQNINLRELFAQGSLCLSSNKLGCVVIVDNSAFYQFLKQSCQLNRMELFPNHDYADFIESLGEQLVDQGSKDGSRSLVVQGKGQVANQNKGVVVSVDKQDTQGKQDKHRRTFEQKFASFRKSVFESMVIGQHDKPLGAARGACEATCSDVGSMTFKLEFKGKYVSKVDLPGKDPSLLRLGVKPLPAEMAKANFNSTPLLKERVARFDAAAVEKRLNGRDPHTLAFPRFEDLQALQPRKFSLGAGTTAANNSPFRISLGTSGVGGIGHIGGGKGVSKNFFDVIRSGLKASNESTFARRK